MPLPPRLTLLATLLAGASLHAEPMLFTPCSDSAAPGSLCSGLNVPGHYDAQGRAVGDADAMPVFMRKFAADVPAGKPAKGTLWLVAGGPGESGASFYSLLPTLRRSFPGFEFLIPDHRGTGHSSRLCKVEESEQSPGGRALAGAEWASCFKGINLVPGYAAQFSITTAARDLKALPEDTVRGCAGASAGFDAKQGGQGGAGHRAQRPAFHPVDGARLFRAGQHPLYCRQAGTGLHAAVPPNYIKGRYAYHRPGIAAVDLLRRGPGGTRLAVHLRLARAGPARTGLRAHQWHRAMDHGHGGRLR